MIKHYWDHDEFIDGRIYDKFETPGFIYIIGNKFIDAAFDCELSKIGFSKNPLQAVRRWKKETDESAGWIIYGVYGIVDSLADHRIHKHLEGYGIQRLNDPILGREWFHVPGECAAAFVRFYLAGNKKFPLRYWFPKELR